MRIYNFTVAGITYRIEAENFNIAMHKLRELVGS